MTSLSNTFEAQPSGTVVSAANSEGPSSHPFDSVLIGSGATLNYDDTHAHAVGMGTRALKVQTAAGAGITTVNWGPGGYAPATDRIFGRCYLYWEATPVSAWRFFQARGAAANFCGFNISNVPRIQIVRASGGITATGTVTLSANTLYRVEFDILFDATFGSANLEVYAGDSGSITDSINGADAFGGTTADEYRFGNTVSQASRGPYWIDDVNINDEGIYNTNIFAPKMPAPRAPRRVRTAPGALLQV